LYQFKKKGEPYRQKATRYNQVPTGNKTPSIQIKNNSKLKQNKNKSTKNTPPTGNKKSIFGPHLIWIIFASFIYI